MSEQKLNIELLKKVRDRILEVPQAYDQQTYFIEAPESPCGTRACIAGETVIMSRSSLNRGIKALKIASKKDSVFNAAQKLLGLSDREASMLFKSNVAGRPEDTCGDPDCALCSRWPEPFASRYVKAKTARGRASAAAAYLDHIIETGKVLE